MSLRTIMSSTANAAATHTGHGMNSSTAITASSSSGALNAPATASGTGGKKSARENRRRATHSQIERRRREKINDRLITLRNLVPACRALMEDKTRGSKGKSGGAGAPGDEDEDGREEDGGTWDGAKRKRKRRKAEPQKKDPGADEELGLHKLDVLTHAIDYIFELHARIEELETGRRPLVKKTADREREEEDRLEAEQAGIAECSTLSAVPAQEDVAFQAGQRLATSARGAAEVASGRGPPQSDDETVSDGLALSDMDVDLPVPHSAEQSSSHEHQPKSSAISSNKKAARTFVHPPRNNIRIPRRGTATASSSSEEHSPPSLLGTSQPSPMILPLNSPMSVLTSPMMSLSAGSPIMQATNKDPTSRKHSASFGSVMNSGMSPIPPFSVGAASNGRWPVLPPPVVPVHQIDTRRASWQFNRDAAVLSDSRTVLRGSPQPGGRVNKGDTIASNPLKSGSAAGKNAGETAAPAAAEHDTSAAHLLLNFSGSPEALRPQTVFSSGQHQQQTAQTRQAPPYATPQVFFTGSKHHGQSADQVRQNAETREGHVYPASAPGGANAQREDFTAGLTSPPLFALDDPKGRSMTPPDGAE